MGHGDCVVLRYIPTRVGKTQFAPEISNDLIGTSPHEWGKLQSHEPVTLEAAVHPHTRGENGSDLIDHGIDVRYIPTRVGKT